MEGTRGNVFDETGFTRRGEGEVGTASVNTSQSFAVNESREMGL